MSVFDEYDQAMSQVEWGDQLPAELVERYGKAVIGLIPGQFKMAWYKAEFQALPRPPVVMKAIGAAKFIGHFTYPAIPSGLETTFEAKFGRPYDKGLFLINLPGSPLVQGASQPVAIFEVRPPG